MLPRRHAVYLRRFVRRAFAQRHFIADGCFSGHAVYSQRLPIRLSLS